MEDANTVKVCEKCRRIRLAVVFMFVLSSVLAGVFWAHVGQSTDNTALFWAIAFTALSTVLILGVEIVVTKVELEAKTLFLHLQSKTEELRLEKEKVAELNRSMSLLANDDDDVRRQLLDERMRRANIEANEAEKLKQE